MSEKILVPVLGESITEATVSKWLKNVGDKVVVDEPLVELETDKVNLEVPSPVSGILSKINSQDGSTVEVGSQLGIVNEQMSPSKEEEIIEEEVTYKNNENNIVNNYTISDNVLTVYPNPNAEGEVTFSVIAFDGELNSEEQNITVNFDNLNDYPLLARLPQDLLMQLTHKFSYDNQKHFFQRLLFLKRLYVALITIQLLLYEVL